MFIKLVCFGEAEWEPTLIYFSEDLRECHVLRFPKSELPLYWEPVWTPELSGKYCVKYGSEQRDQQRKNLRITIKHFIDPGRYFQFAKCLVSCGFVKNLTTKLISSAGCDEKTQLRIVLATKYNSAICYAWCQRMLQLINDFIHVFEVMAWLSTLGGAYSAMGEYDDKYAKVAKNISMTQLRLAVKLGDPTQVCRCYIFLAISALQRGKLRLSKKILLYQWKLTHTVDELSEPQLKNMILGTWKRLSHERNQRIMKRNKKTLLSTYGQPDVV